MYVLNSNKALVEELWKILLFFILVLRKERRKKNVLKILDDGVRYVCEVLIL